MCVLVGCWKVDEEWMNRKDCREEEKKEEKKSGKMRKCVFICVGDR